jgi:hypothetical protein
MSFEQTYFVLGALATGSIITAGMRAAKAIREARLAYQPDAPARKKPRILVTVSDYGVF